VRHAHPLKDVAASVHQRLLNRARKSGRPFNELLQLYAMERFLYRLSKTRHAERFVLKGALMLMAWRGPASRPTKDIDLLGRMKNDMDAVALAVRDACRQEVEPDGMAFDADSVQMARIAEDAGYEGVRARLLGSLGKARVFLQIDVGFGDTVSPAARMVVYPTVLDFPAPRLRGYSRESTIAEKFHAMVKREALNSRMRDFYDVWLLSRQFDFDGRVLATAVQKTFANRDTDVPSSSVALSGAFGEQADKATMWRAYVRRSRLGDAPESFAGVVAAVAAFLGPVAAALSGGRDFNKEWEAGGPWAG
jgi:predicted nucleotidyltransferase component of viral defense system